MALDNNKFLQTLNNAKSLMALEQNGTLDKIASDPVHRSLVNESFESTDPYMLNNALKSKRQQQTPTMDQMIQRGVPDNKKTTSNLPKEILESFEKTPPIGGNGMTSTEPILDTLGLTQQIQESMPTQKAPLRETVNYTIPQQPLATANIDYSLIKTIVEDCVKKAVGSIKKSILTENTTNNGDELSLIKLGENFKFVTKSGDIYEGKLRKIGNINKK